MDLVSVSLHSIQHQRTCNNTYTYYLFLNLEGPALQRMASQNMTPANWSIKAIPTAFALGLMPHSYYLIRLMMATRGQISTAMYAICIEN